MLIWERTGQSARSAAVAARRCFLKSALRLQARAARERSRSRHNTAAVDVVLTVSGGSGRALTC